MKRLVLAGAGHAHLHVLRALAHTPVAPWQVTLVSPSARQLYSGALPGWIAGHHALDEAIVAVQPLVARAGVHWRRTTVEALDADAGVLHCADGSRLSFDALSLDTGSAPAGGVLAEADACDTVLPLRPLDRLAATWPGLMQEIAGRMRPFHLLIVGAGAGGVELAFAVQHRSLREGWTHLQVTLAGAQALPLPGAPMAARQRLAALLAQHGVAWRGGHRAVSIAGQQVLFAGQPAIAFDQAWLATGARAPAWLKPSGLALDNNGFVQVGPTLQSLSHPQVFGAGDVAAHPQPLPKSGVYAVRAGLVLAHNLNAFCRDGPLREWTPQRRALYLIGTAGRRALGLWGPVHWEAAWAWHLKRWIDGRFVRSYRMTQPS